MLTRLTTTLRPTARPQCLRTIPLRHPTIPLLRPTTLHRPIYTTHKPTPPRVWSPLTLLALLFSGIGIGTAIWGYSAYLTFLSKTLHNYPAPVSRELRKALYYGLYNQPVSAIPHFRAALEKCAELGMDPLSDEVTGIKIELAGVLEKNGGVEKTVEILEHVLDEVVAGGKERGGGERTRLLKRGVGVGLKLGALYVEMGKRGEAEEALVWAVETVLRERGRREKEGVEEGEGEWLSDEEVGMALENLAGFYGDADQHFLASPLYLQALDLLAGNSCHAVVLMNNLSTSLAQQKIPPGAPVTRHQLIEESATKWAQKALKVAENIKPPDRTEECDTGCAVAMYNLAEFAEMLGDRDLARQRYMEAVSLAKGLELTEGVEKAEEGLRRLESGK